MINVYVVSACLLGHNCKYNGGNNENSAVMEFCKTHNHIGVCPEKVSGLPVPREPAEFINGRVVNRSGEDVTEYFEIGTNKVIGYLEKFTGGDLSLISGAILKANSPSCGSGEIYDGTFSGKIISGDGMLAAALKAHGISVYTEKNLSELLDSEGKVR